MAALLSSVVDLVRVRYINDVNMCALSYCLRMGQGETDLLRMIRMYSVVKRFVEAFMAFINWELHSDIVIVYVF